MRPVCAQSQGTVHELTAHRRLPAPQGQVEEPSSRNPPTSFSDVHVTPSEVLRTVRELVVHAFLPSPTGRGTILLSVNVKLEAPMPHSQSLCAMQKFLQLD